MSCIYLRYIFGIRRTLVVEQSEYPTIGKKMAVVGRQNQLEYFLQGSVGKESVNTLLHRLRGLCDGASRQSATFVDHEMLYTLGNECIICTLFVG